MRLAGLATLVAGISLAAAAQAEIRTPAKVRYATQDGQSRWQEVEVTFVTGAELNEGARSFRYDWFKTYAVIFFSRDQAAVIRNSGTALCGSKFDMSCLPPIGNFKGVDQGGRSWEICTGALCF